jgi:3-hydroxyisobutyrate dehydrogenase
MGCAIAARLAGQGYRVAGWTRSGTAGDRAPALGVAPVLDIESLASGSDIVMLSLFDDAAVTAVVQRLSKCDLHGKLIVDTSTVSPETLRSLADGIRRAGGAALDAPISGGPEMVLAGQAGVYIGGDQQDVDRYIPVAESFSNRIYRVGGPGDGAAAKAVNNVMIIAYWQCLKEALQIGKKAGLTAETMLRILSTSSAANGALGPRIPIILGESEEAGFTVRGVIKDASLFTGMAERYCVPTPALDAALASFSSHRDRGNGEADPGTMLRAAYADA